MPKIKEKNILRLVDAKTGEIDPARAIEILQELDDSYWRTINHVNGAGNWGYVRHCDNPEKSAEACAAIVALGGTPEVRSTEPFGHFDEDRWLRESGLYRGWFICGKCRHRWSKPDAKYGSACPSCGNRKAKKAYLGTNEPDWFSEKEPGYWRWILALTTLLVFAFLWWARK